jgi:hypothetical protein
MPSSALKCIGLELVPADIGCPHAARPRGIRMRRRSPWRMVLGISVVAALLFGASGIAPTISQWRDDSPVTGRRRR